MMPSTILITVLTNSFTAIASNAEQEHQFLFAINTISMVKNDALFSYIAPGNIIAWLLMPLRYVMSMREFVRMNRTAIKLTHWPLLLVIFCYEKYFLASEVYEPTDLIENQGRSRARLISFADPASRTALFSPNIGAREGSIAGQQKDQALAEVFWRVPDANVFRHQRRQERRKSQTAIRNWMDQNDDQGEPLSHWPTMDSRRSGGSKFARRFRAVSDVRSAASDPADLLSNIVFPSGGRFRHFDGPSPRQELEDKDQTDADGDDELITNDDEDEVATEDPRGTNSRHDDEEEDYFTTPRPARLADLAPASLASTRSSIPPTATMSPRGPRRQGLHNRTLSTNTILYAPQEVRDALDRAEADSESDQPVAPRSRPLSSRQNTVAVTPVSSGTRSPRRSIYIQPPTRPKPIPMKTAPGRAPVLSASVPRRRAAVTDDMDMNSDLGLDTSHAGAFNGVPASFQTQMAWATGQLKGANQKTRDRQDDSDRLSRLMLAKMKALEERFDNVAREIQATRSILPTAQNSGDERSSVGAASGTGGLTIEIAGRERKRPMTAYKRPATQGGQSHPTSGVEEKPVLSRRNTKQRGYDKAKGKGKEIAQPHEGSGDDEKEPRRLRRRGSSF